MARYSRAVSHFTRLPADLSDQEVVDLLTGIADRHSLHGGVLFPGTDRFMRIVAQHAGQLGRYFVLTTPSWETVRCIYDKRLTYELAHRAELHIPESWQPGSLDGLNALQLTYPVVLKPAITPHLLKGGMKKAYRAGNRQELKARFEAMSQVVEPSEIIVQELLPDPSENLFSFAGYFRQGEPLVGLTVRRKRQFPADFGIYSTLVETVDLPQLEALAGKLLRSLDYTGLAEVEFMWDPKQRCFKLLEVNARLWAWNGLAVAAGLDLPYVTFALATGQNPPLGSARVGIKWMKLSTDVKLAVHEIRAGRLAARQYLSSLRAVKTFAVASISDPLPFAAELFLVAFRRLKNLLSRKNPG